MGALAGAAADALRRASRRRSRCPAPQRWTGPYDLLVTGVGGTGVVTVGALIAMAAHLEGKSASVLDFMGFAQKGGAVLSFVRLAERRRSAEPGAHRRAAGRRGARLRHRRRRVAPTRWRRSATAARASLANTHEIAGRRIRLRNPDADLHVDALLDKLSSPPARTRVETLDAQPLARGLPRRHDRRQHRRAGLRVAARPGAGRPGGDAARDRAERRRGREQQDGVRARPARRRRPGALRATLLHEPDPERARDAETLDALIERAARFLDRLPERALRRRYRRSSPQVRAREKRRSAPTRRCR